MQSGGPGLAAVGAERRLAIWFAWYAIGLFAVLLLVSGDLAFTVLLIVVSETVLLFLQPQPRFPASTYRPPAPDQWQAPITTLRWMNLIGNAWSVGTGALALTIVVGIWIVVVLIAGWKHGVGAGNVAVVVLLAVWLSTRPLWIGPLRRALKIEVAKTVAGYTAALYREGDSFVFDLRPIVIGRAPQRTLRFSVGFAELDEVRLMDGLSAQGYLAAMAQYDPTLTARMEFDLVRFMADPRARPSIFLSWGVGAHLLLRGPTVLYMVSNAEQVGPLAIADWTAWKASQPRNAPAGGPL